MTYWGIIVVIATGGFGLSLGIALRWQATTALEKTFSVEFSLAIRRAILLVSAASALYLGLLWGLSIS